MAASDRLTGADAATRPTAPEADFADGAAATRPSQPAPERLDPSHRAWPDAALLGLTEVGKGVRRLYALGDIGLLERCPDRSVAIVGTRDASPYGVRVAGELASAFARAGITVVSGLARGIDSAAHRGALEAGGITVAVLGTGVDVPYPVSNRALHARIACEGLVLSEMEPSTTAFAGGFPRRNRIIAALAKVTIVVEAPFKSGAINTATHATELGRVVGIVPGQIDSPRSAGSNLLLRDGAHPILSAADALALFELFENETVARPRLAYHAERVWSALEEGEASSESLAARLGMSIRQVFQSTTELELAGLIRAREDGTLARR
jgi:DNA processing protein